jgi:hypothetical protein
MPVGECLHELAQHFRRTPVFGQASPLERLAEFPFNTDTKASVFARHRVTVSHGYTFVYPKKALFRRIYPKFCDTPCIPLFPGVIMLQKSVANSLLFATIFATKGAP